MGCGLTRQSRGALNSFAVQFPRRLAPRRPLIADVRPPEKRQMYVSMNAHPLTVIIIVGTLMVTPIYVFAN